MKELASAPYLFGISILLALPVHLSYASEAGITKPAELIRLAETENSNCRGGSGDDPSTAVSCFERDRLLRKIKESGWCWGPASVPGYQKKWITCKSDDAGGRSVDTGMMNLDPSWRRFTSTTYVMSPANFPSPFLSATLREGVIHINFIDAKSKLCEKGENSALSETGPYKINDTYVRFQSMCLNGTRLTGPLTSGGKAFMLEALDSDGIKAELESGPPVIFYKTDFESVKRELRKTESAL